VAAAAGGQRGPQEGLRLGGAMTDERVPEGRARLGEEVASVTDERVPEGRARLGEEVI